MMTSETAKENRMSLNKENHSPGHWSPWTLNTGCFFFFYHSVVGFAWDLSEEACECLLLFSLVDHWKCYSHSWGPEDWDIYLRLATRMEKWPEAVFCGFLRNLIITFHPGSRLVSRNLRACVAMIFGDSVGAYHMLGFSCIPYMIKKYCVNR